MLLKIPAGGGTGGSIDVDDEISDISENPVQNKVIAEALKNVKIPVDDEINAESENPVQNKTIAAKIKEIVSKLVTDKTLKISNGFAEAKTVGDKFTSTDEEISSLDKS